MAVVETIIFRAVCKMIGSITIIDSAIWISKNSFHLFVIM